MSFAPERPSTEFIGVSQERLQQAQEQYTKVRQQLTQAAQEIVRYAQMSNPSIDPVQLTVTMDGALQQAVTTVIQHIDRSGRVQPGTLTWVDARSFQRLENKLSQSGGYRRGGRRR